MADQFSLPVAFHFSVSLVGRGVFDTNAAFREVSGLETEIATEEVTEGGENTFVHRLPKGRRQGNLKLQRGIATGADPLLIWCKNVLEAPLNKEIDTAMVLVKLLDEEQSAIALWRVANCWPVKWQIGGFDAMKNELAIETIELAYTTIYRVPR